MENPLDYDLADFFFNESPNILTPPPYFNTWVNDPGISATLSFFEQPLLSAPSAVTRICSNLDGQKRRVINLTSYNYLGLSTHPEVLKACSLGLKEYGMGASGAPVLSGTFDLHVKLAKMLSHFKQKDDTVLYSSGFGGNLGAIQGLVRKGDLLVMDNKIHRSLIDGGTLSGAKMVFFAHNDMQHLNEILEKNKHKRILVIVEGVYSMDGDLVKLPELIEVTDQYPNVSIYLDDAHSTLMFGKYGRGIAEHFNLEHKIGISFGTLSKSFGGLGGFVSANKETIQYLKCYSSPYAFSCSLPPCIVAGLIKALEVATRDSTLRDKMWENTRYFKNELVQMGLNIGETESQIIPIIIGSSRELLYEMATKMQLAGLLLQPVVFPAVPHESLRFRISMTAQITKDEMDEALNIIQDVVAKKLAEKIHY